MKLRPVGRLLPCSRARRGFQVPERPVLHLLPRFDLRTLLTFRTNWIRAFETYMQQLIMHDVQSAKNLRKSPVMSASNKYESKWSCTKLQRLNGNRLDDERSLRTGNSVGGRERESAPSMTRGHILLLIRRRLHHETNISIDLNAVMTQSHFHAAAIYEPFRS